MGESDLNILYTIYAGTLVFFMHAGFSLLECGYVQRKNQQSILIKNLMAICGAAVGYFLVGYGISFGRDSRSKTAGGGFLGTSLYWADEETLISFSEDGQTVSDSRHYHYFFQFTFCATAATIVSGAVAERITLEAFTIFSIYLTSFVYPCVAHWAWSSPGGVLAYEGYTDFAGSGVVHMTGGWAALAGAMVIGPRQGYGGDEPLKQSSMVLIAFGTLILWFGWYGFNAGSTTAVEHGAVVDAARCCVTTTLAGSTGGIVLFALTSLAKGKHDVSQFCNGILAGLVSITAGCNNTDPAVSILVGAVGAVICLCASLGLSAAGIDDVVGAFPVHGAAGCWGVVAAGLFDMDKGVFYEQGAKTTEMNLIGMAVIASWAFANALVAFLIMKQVGILRVDPEVESVGLDSEFEVSHQRTEGESESKCGL